MTASQIIEEIKRLDPKEQLVVIRFAYQLDVERRLTGKELSALAERMVNTLTPWNRHECAKKLSAASTAKNKMPRIRRRDLPPALLNHLLDRISERAISAEQLEEFAEWLDTEPDNRRQIQATWLNKAE